ncbi:hypothetical protein Pmani_019211 [Petrolisthes manimaculis]|uniref:Uncharacterized protein n=1 Tax=Petrolisthes manimaculis TaxID=1843537 RepID=A0AAE1U7N2_9EUCA|nr:hypothetical protein Pmani_019211 [Petrolisthes manimaculis]
MNIFIYHKFGTKNHTRYADVDKIGRSRGQVICDSLHAFTGCDCVSSFVSKDKLTVLKLLKTHSSNQALKQLCQCWQGSDGMLEKLEQFTCVMYTDSNSNSATVGNSVTVY